MKEHDKLVVYIVGANRSGSTLLDYLISCHPDAVSVGELHHLNSFYNRGKGMGVLYDWRCSCGEKVQACYFWSKILSEVHFSKTYQTRIQMVPYHSKTDRLKHIFKRLFQKGYLFRDESLQSGQEFAEQTWEIYDKIFEFTGKPIIIDSSKSALEAFFLQKHKRANIQFLYLKRDILGLSTSQYKRSHNIPAEIRKYWHPKERTITGVLLNILRKQKSDERILREMQDSSKKRIIKRIKYEDLAQDPNKVTKEITSFLKIRPYRAPLLTGQYDETPHVLCGSPDRYKEREIKLDENWKSFFKNKPGALVLGKILQKV